MRVILQRASEGDVRVDGDVVGALTQPGLVALVGFTHDDDTTTLTRMAEKILNLRIFDEEKSAKELGAPVLAVSQFTLYADTRKGRRPSWSAAAPGSISEPLMTEFVELLRKLGSVVETGVFGANMQVSLVNDGPVTIILDSADWTRK